MAAKNPMLINGDEEKSHEKQPPSNGGQPSRTSPLLIDLNSRPTENAADDDYFPDSESDSDIDDDEYGDHEDPDDGDEEVQELAEMFMAREISILMTWIEEVRREILKIREELRILQKKLGLDGEEANEGMKLCWRYLKRGLKSIWSALKYLAAKFTQLIDPVIVYEGRRYVMYPSRFY